ncbi:MAG: hypothetical protein GEU86_06975 [Actinophytocola sp.]|nr:hypothetical protein [Actinophytocola sp.]
MVQPPEVIIGVKKWPAFVLAALVPMVIALLAGVLALMLRSGSSSGALWVVWLVVALAGSAAMLASVCWAVYRAFDTVRHPPRLSGHGIRMWLAPTREYLLVPWQRIAVVRFEPRGISTALLVFVANPEELAKGDRRAAQRIRRMMRQFGGTPFVYPVTRSRLGSTDEAVRWFSGGRLALQR